MATSLGHILLSSAAILYNVSANERLGNLDLIVLIFCSDISQHIASMIYVYLTLEL